MQMPLPAASVSYTHLDVYKRQHQRGAGIADQRKTVARLQAGHNFFRKRLFVMVVQRKQWGLDAEMGQ